MIRYVINRRKLQICNEILKIGEIKHIVDRCVKAFVGLKLFDKESRLALQIVFSTQI